MDTIMDIKSTIGKHVLGIIIEKIIRKKFNIDTVVSINDISIKDVVEESDYYDIHLNINAMCNKQDLYLKLKEII